MALSVQQLGSAEFVYLEKPPSIGQRIRQIRISKGWTFDDMVRKTGLSRGTLWEAEHREGRTPWRTTVEKIAEALDVPVEYLYTGTIPVKDGSLADFSPEMYGRAQGIKSPERLRVLRDIVQDFKLLDELVEDEPVE